jgi:hypothetical protein
VQLLFRLIRLKAHNTLFQIPAPDQGRENWFHEDLRTLREGHLVHAVEDNGSPAGRFKAGRLVDLFPWALKLPEIAKTAKTSDGRFWEDIQGSVNKETVEIIKKELEAQATAPK